MKNFPIYGSHYHFTLDEILLYSSLFEHHFSIKTKTKNKLVSKHHFTDGLSYFIHWDLHESLHPTDRITLKDIFLLKNEDGISPFSYEFVSFSTESSFHPEDADRFFHFFPSKKELSLIDYKLLELMPNIKTDIPDIFFDDLLQSIENILKFEEYYKNKNN
jgi:hypothetical protein